MSRTTGIILLTIISLVLHLLEEIKTGFRSKLPVGEMPVPVFVAINAVMYAFCFATLALSVGRASLAMPFAWVFAIGMFLNGLGHVAVMLATRRYFPGGVTAVLLLLFSVCLIVHLRRG